MDALNAQIFVGTASNQGADKISDDLITDIVLGPAVSPAAIALDIVVPGQARGW